MSSWQKLELKERLAILTTVSEKTGIPVENAIEKDWWVSIVLKALFQTNCSTHLTFKGGTSLSKGWNLIQRFSEDIDLALHHSFFGDTPQNNNQRKTLRKKSRRYVNETLIEELDDKLKELGVSDYSVAPEEGVDSDKDPTVIFVNYTSILSEQKEYVTPTVKIEISCSSMSEPYELRDIFSLIFDYFPEEDSINTCKIPTVLPTRTFLEKLFLLSEEFCKDNPRCIRMSRHLYDLEKLMDTEFGKNALTDTELYKQIVNHRAVNYHLGHVDYKKHHPATITFMPSTDEMEKWSDDYKDMVTNFIYEDGAKNFDDLIKRMEELTARLRDVKIDGNIIEK